ncbi:hypothetical protein JZ751_017316 [Albula glossodonta]|uniref:Polynucleotide 5'-hydroxyl-kinase NOL9 n=1 Tax=Albula glossodonta TaxID=121402 RepID=A0A8T2PKL0_9TELE|nr:hypothetical protein JZ751_017316 [Albula glossodonta]
MGQDTAFKTQGQWTLCFREKCQLMCLYGRVEILGFTIEEGQQAHPVFSPPTHCPLTITAMGNSATTKTQKEPRVEAKAIIQQYLPTKALRSLQGEVDSDSCLDLLAHLDTPLTRFPTSCPEHNESDGCPVIVVCGGKNAGKSTFNRNLINILLNLFASVNYQECDLGQTEFTPLGCLSLSTITEPLLVMNAVDHLINSSFSKWPKSAQPYSTTNTCEKP